MSVSIIFNGLTYTIPQTGDESWGENLTSYFTAIPQGALQKTGGAFTLTAEVNFGATFGVLSAYFKTRAANPSGVGLVRLAVGDSIGWRNNANDGNLLLSVNGSNELVFNGTSIISNAITALTGDVTATGPGSVAATIAANAVTNSKFRQSAALSVVGNSTNALANVADITAGTDGFVLRRSGTTLDFGLLVNANIDAAAAIDFSKLAALTSGNILVGSAGNVATSVAMSGDVTIGNTGVTAIGTNKVTLGMLAQIATQTFLGRTTASTGNVEDLTATQATAILNSFVGDSGSGGTKGLVPAPAAGDSAAGRFLKADGTWEAPAGAGTVTSVAMTVPTALFSVSPVAGSPVTSAGTLAPVLATQTANTVFAGPTDGSAATPTFRAMNPADSTVSTANFVATQNLGISASVAANALTIALKQNDGSTDAAASSPVVIGFRNATATSGAYSRRTVTGSLSLVVPSGASLGHTASMAQYVWVYLLDNSGTPELAVSGVKLFDDYSIASSTTISAGATSGSVLYSTTGRSNVPIRLIGRLTSNQSAAGTWASAMSEAALCSDRQPPTLTDWATYTPTYMGFGTVSTQSMWWRRDGDSLLMQGTFTIGTVTAAEGRIGFPGSIVSDPNKMSTTLQLVGIMGRNTSSAAFFGAYNTAEPNVGYLTVSAQTSALNNMTKKNADDIFGSGETVSVSTCVRIPIKGWSTFGP